MRCRFLKKNQNFCKPVKTIEACDWRSMESPIKYTSTYVHIQGDKTLKFSFEHYAKIRCWPYKCDWGYK